MKVYIGMPLYTDVAANPVAVQRAVGNNGLDCPYTFQAFASSLLPKAFNHLWANAVFGGWDFFVMLHADIAPEAKFAGKLKELLLKHDADMVSAIVPIKSEKGLTSAGIGDPDNPWNPLFRFTMHQLAELPGTFTADDIGWKGYPLMVNTGLWIADLRRPWCRLTDKNGAMAASFKINSRVVYDAERKKVNVQTESEDWYFSRVLHALGCKVMATQEVSLLHFGSKSWSNQDRWGIAHDELADRPVVMEEARKAQASGIHAHGYWLDRHLESQLRSVSSLPHLKNNLMVFEQMENMETSP